MEGKTRRTHERIKWEKTLRDGTAEVEVDSSPL